MSKSTIPLFPLNGAILFPNTNLPLNIFEERYVDMINFALANGRLIGMIQSKKNKSLYSVGCIGKINSFEESGDGRFVINLIGIKYFKFVKELSSKHKFRMVEAESINEKIKLNYNLSKSEKELLLKKYTLFIKKNTPEADLDFLKTIETETLLKFIAMSSPFSISEKQMLLETYDIKKLNENISILLDFYNNQKRDQMLIN